MPPTPDPGPKRRRHRRKDRSADPVAEARATTTVGLAKKMRGYRRSRKCLGACSAPTTGLRMGACPHSVDRLTWWISECQGAALRADPITDATRIMRTSLDSASGLAPIPTYPQASTDHTTATEHLPTGRAPVRAPSELSSLPTLSAQSSLRKR